MCEDTAVGFIVSDKLLEHEVGTSLFDRAVSGMKLIRAGGELLLRVRTPVNALEQAIWGKEKFC